MRLPLVGKERQRQRQRVEATPQAQARHQKETIWACPAVLAYSDCPGLDQLQDLHPRGMHAMMWEMSWVELEGSWEMPNGQLTHPRRASAQAELCLHAQTSWSHREGPHDEGLAAENRVRWQMTPQTLHTLLLHLALLSAYSRREIKRGSDFQDLARL